MMYTKLSAFINIVLIKKQYNNHLLMPPNNKKIKIHNSLFVLLDDIVIKKTCFHHEC